MHEQQVVDCCYRRIFIPGNSERRYQPVKRIKLSGVDCFLSRWCLWISPLLFNYLRFLCPLYPCSYFYYSCRSCIEEAGIKEREEEGGTFAG